MMAILAKKLKDLHPESWKQVIQGLFTVLVIVWFIWFIGYEYNHGKNRKYGGGTTDMAVFYVAGSSVTGRMDIKPPEIYDKSIMRPAVQSIKEKGGTLYLYLPPTAVLFAPFSYLDLETTAVLWALLSSLLFVVAYYLAIRYVLNDLQWFRLRYAVILLLIGYSEPLASAAATGQINIAVWILLVLAMIGVIRKSPYLAGILLGLATTIKLFPILFLPYLLIKKQYKTVGAMISTGIGMILLSLPWFGISGWKYFFENRFFEVLGGSLGYGWSSVSLYGSLRAGIKNETYAFITETKHELITWMGTPYMLLTVGLLCFIAVLLWRRRELMKREDVLLEMSLLFALVTFMPKIVHAQYVFWLIPFMLWLMTKEWKEQEHWKWLILGWLSFGLIMFNDRLPDLLLGVIKPITLGVGILFTVLVVVARKKKAIEA